MCANRNDAPFIPLSNNNSTQLFERSQDGFRRCLDQGATAALLQTLELAIDPAVPVDALPTYRTMDTAFLCKALLPLYLQYMLRFHQAEIDEFRCVCVIYL